MVAFPADAVCELGLLAQWAGSRGFENTLASLVGMCSFSVVKTYCGHGIGDLFHCAPNIPHYAHNKAKGVMQPGQTFTIEP